MNRHRNNELLISNRNKVPDSSDSYLNFNFRPSGMSVSKQLIFPKVYGRGLDGGVAGQPVLFNVDMRDADLGRLTCKCRTPSGRMTYLLVSDNRNGTYTIDLNTCEPGLHTINLEWNGETLPGCPFITRIHRVEEVRMIRVYGPGSSKGDHVSNIFHVMNNETCPGRVKVELAGPEDAFYVDIWSDIINDRIINFRFRPEADGIYSADILWENEDGTEFHVTGSPYVVFLKNRNRNDVMRKNKPVKRDNSTLVSSAIIRDGKDRYEGTGYVFEDKRTQESEKTILDSVEKVKKYIQGGTEETFL